MKRGYKYYFTTTLSSWGYRQFIALDILFNPEKGFIVNDQLIVNVEIEPLLQTETSIPKVFLFYYCFVKFVSFALYYIAIYYCFFGFIWVTYSFFYIF